MLKKEVKTVQRNGISYLVKNGKAVRYKPWLGDAFSFLYDNIMEKSIFPKKFKGDLELHYSILRNELQGVHKQRVLELAAGAGSVVNFLPNDNQYTGTDISPGLLSKAAKKMQKSGFEQSEFFVTGVEELPFQDQSFDMILCILALNFFDDLKGVLKEIRRVAVPGATFLCAVPEPERKDEKSEISGSLYTEWQLKNIFTELGFVFCSISAQNGAVFYFKAKI